MLVVMVSGRAGEGKTTFSDYCIEHMRRKPYFRIGRKVSFASGVKSIAREFGWDGQKDNRGRNLLQQLGNTGRNFNPDIWANIALRDLTMIKNILGADVVFIDDWRFPNEGNLVSKKFKTLKVRIIRPEQYHTLYGTPYYNDESETALPLPYQKTNNKFYDVLVYNSTTLDTLNKTAKDFVETLHKKHWR